MDKCIEDMWSPEWGGNLLSHMFLPQMANIFLMLLCAADTHDQVPRAFLILLALGNAWKVIFLILLPLARITSRCNSLKASRRSIPNLANAFFGRDGMGHEASLQHSIFVQYLKSEPAG